MPIGSIILRPGVNTELTPSLNEAGISESQLIRFRQGIPEKLGGWSALLGGVAIGSTARDVHTWGGFGTAKYLAVGGTQTLTIYNSSLGALKEVTPQTETRNFTPGFKVLLGSNLVTVVDDGSSASTYQKVLFNTQVTVGGVRLEGLYPVHTVLGASAYTVVASQVSTTAVALSSGTLPTFTTTAGSAAVTVTLPSHNYTAGFFEQFIASTTVSGIAIQGPYEVASVIDSTTFTINLTTTASATATSTMNAGLAQVVYYRTQGPPATGSGYGYGGYGSVGAYGTGTATSGSTGTPITAADWTMDNWGHVLLACPKDGPIYTWVPNTALNTADVIANAPAFNGGIFVSMPQQILVSWRSVTTAGVQDPLRVRWCDAEDFNNWTVSNQTTAGSFKIPTGSRIMGGMQGPTQGIISTDIDVWTMQYIGGNLIFNFSRVGAGCGWVGPHAAGVLGGNVFWCGGNNFFMLSGRGVQDIPCPVWDFFFQNLNVAYQEKIQCSPNSLFNEISWFFPSTGSTECDSYVKLNTADGAWDYGKLSRTAWVDASIFGNPIGIDAGGYVWQHEITNDGGGVPLLSSFQSGYWRISEGSELVFVDWVLPDMKFGLYSNAITSAAVQITFYAVDYLGDTPRTYGPYIFTNTTEYITTRIRGRYMAVQIATADSGSFWRLGRINYRWQPAGRR